MSISILSKSSRARPLRHAASRAGFVLLSALCLLVTLPAPRAEAAGAGGGSSTGLIPGSEMERLIWLGGQCTIWRGTDGIQKGYQCTLGDEKFICSGGRCVSSPLVADLAEDPSRDRDGDLVDDPEDNCSEIFNPEQVDSDRDGFGNVCDADYDNDLEVTLDDFNLFLRSFGGPGQSTDHDGDGATTLDDFAYLLGSMGGAPGPGAQVPLEEAGASRGILRQGWIDGRTFSNRQLSFEDVDGRAIFEGDMILGRTEDLLALPVADTWTSMGASEDGIGSGSYRSIVLSGDRYRWPDGVVPYTISPDFDATMVDRIERAIEHWEANTVIRLVERTASNASQHPDYVQFSPADGVCQADVGRRGRMQGIELDTGCGFGAVVHEIGHTVGLWHEQSREDRDDFVDIRYENVQAGADDSCDSYDEGDKCHNFDQHISDGDDIGAYDYASIMHYGRRAFSKNGEDTIVPHDPNARIGQRSGLSDGDIAAVQEIYGTLYPAWLASYSGTGRWTKLAYSVVGTTDLGFGDFDGDGRTDVFRSNPTRGYWYVSWGGQSKWEILNSSGVALSGLRFGDFDGDGRTDVFRASNGAWNVSYGGSGRWTRVNASNVAMSSLRFGDFDGDGRTDVFRISGTTWYVSYGAATGWTALNTSGVPLDRLRFEDFDGDGRTDVFKTTDGVWYVSYGGAGRWTAINGSNVPLANLRFGDFDGDGRADIFKTIDATWFVSYAGLTRWTELNTSGVPITSLRFGDFDGDGRTDVFRSGSSY